MTQEEKLKEAKRLYKNLNETQRYVLELLFPELAESEDERIRKTLIEYFNAYPKVYFCELKKSHILSWLEKQGKPVEINPTEFDLRLNSLLKQFESLSKEELASSLSFYLNVVQNDGTYKDEEKQDEQNPANKVEPKFKVGDYVVDNCGYVWRIEGIMNQLYLLEGVEGGESRPTIEWVNKTFHLWDITKDAKDGDVLVDSNWDVILMFRRIGNAEWDDVIDYYCYYDCYRKVFSVQKGVEYWGSTNNSRLKPSTKEQRDTLMRAMTDKGYTFGFEKKELKKIERKSALSLESTSND